jgi:hypothetical protein
LFLTFLKVSAFLCTPSWPFKTLLSTPEVEP